jgi:branched-chain amino acid transport system permease protein
VFGKLRRVLPAYLVLGVASLIALTGAAAMIEMLYHLQLNAALGPKMAFLGATLDAQAGSSWVGAVVLLAIGAALFEWRRRGFARDWGQIAEEIETETKRREGL